MAELYIHIPFCVRKCLYCDFLSASAEEAKQSAYVLALSEEMRQKAEVLRGNRVTSVFIGGGTPSILQAEEVTAFTMQMRTSFCITSDAEITIEVNPGTVTMEKLKAYRKAGINRLSIGLQSAQNEELRRIGRIHTWEDFLLTFEAARESGFDNINIDLMAALPGQTLLSCQDSVERVLRLQPEHISAYSLILEEGTPLYEQYGGKEKDMPPLPDEDEERDMYDFTEKRLQEAGYLHYEISNYAKPQKECRHNIGYWKRTDYLGLGIGAASLVHNERWSNTRNREAYCSGDFSKQEVQKLTRKEQMEEAMFLGLRLTGGVSGTEFAACFGVPMEEIYGHIIKENILKKLLEITRDNGIRLTKRGREVSNTVMAEFLF